MRTKTINCYQYSELSDKAKEKARDWWINASAGDSFAWDNMKDDAKSAGLRLDGTDRGYMKGDFVDSAAVCADTIIREHGKDCETFKTASAFLIEHTALWVKYRAAEEKDESARAVEDEITECEAEFLRSILEDYRIIYEKDEEYQQSEEAIAETMEANEYEFDENGRRV